MKRFNTEFEADSIIPFFRNSVSIAVVLRMKGAKANGSFHRPMRSEVMESLCLPQKNLARMVILNNIK
ncbi:hypothetical protein SDC9_63139 [bioreactor metagenome]|uniref:Uncharacterized protein n=1 Tax=bioreactor metagenome TaxID=1076179 RepID=A0A644XLB8_9ZZZZ